ncbi:MAG: M48 family metallopeptidase [Chlamydiales bacterium]|nr:M48 family metallopeptidase [Chlamydiales bacterium]
MSIKRFFRAFVGVKKSRSRALSSPQGECYNLKEIYDRLNAHYFEGKLDLAITWVGDKSSMPRRRVMFGSYNQRDKRIHIHRRLDQAHIPEHFISYVIYHEMLHHVLPPLKSRRHTRRIHHPAFIQREKEFQEYDLAKTYSQSMRSSWFSK